MFTTILRENEIIEVDGPARFQVLKRDRTCRAGGMAVKIAISAPKTTKITVGPKPADELAANTPMQSSIG